MNATLLRETASQTAGPYVHIGLAPAAAGLPLRTQEKPNVLVGATTQGERIRIEGLIYDGAGALVKDALVELWQANANGHYGSNDFTGFGRAAADFESGQFFFETVKPGRTPYRDGRMQAPHVTLSIFARGINIHLQTRLYFSDEDNASDPVLQLVGAPELIATLIAQRDPSRPLYRFEIHLQGDRETVFFDL